MLAGYQAIKPTHPFQVLWPSLLFRRGALAFAAG
jgi:hypothetical protein